MPQDVYVYNPNVRVPYNVQDVVIPDGVTIIDKDAFSNCRELRSITIPDSVTIIDESAFSNCEELRFITIPDSVIKIRKWAFWGCRNLQSITIPDSVTKIESDTFAMCDNLQSVTLPDGIKEIGINAFLGCGSLQSIKLPSGITTIRGSAFASCTGLRSITMPNGITKIEENAFGYCKNLRSVTIPDSVTQIGKNAFQYCHNLRSITIPDSVKRIGASAFGNCKNLQYITLPNSITRIKEKYEQTVPGFKLADYPYNIEPVGITYGGLTARVLNLSEEKDIALAARLGELTDCCQRLGSAGETAMMHGFLNPDAGFWVIEDKDGKVRAQAEIWETHNGNLVFDNIEFADTDNEHLIDRADRLRGVIAAWAVESGYKNIIMGCGYSELGTDFMEQAPVPELRLTPEEVFALWKSNDAGVSFKNLDEARKYIQTDEYNPDDFVYTDANKQCVYIKKDGEVSDYLMQGYDKHLTGNRNPHEKKSAGRRTRPGNTNWMISCTRTPANGVHT